MRFEAETKVSIPGGRMGSNKVHLDYEDDGIGVDMMPTLRIKASSLDTMAAILTEIESATRKIRAEIQEMRK